MEYLIAGMLGGFLGYGLRWLESRHEINKAKAVYPLDNERGRHHLKNIVEDVACLECEKKIAAELCR